MSVNKKDSTNHHVDKTLSPSPTSIPSEVDDAWTFLDAHRDANIGDESVDILAIRRKIDYRVVPLGFLLYMMQFADKLVLNYAGVMTMREDLNLRGNDFSNLVTAVYVAVIVWELPTIYLLQRFPVAKYLAINAILWGVSTACGAAATSFGTMLVTRIFLGIFEATINPSLMLIAGRWYTKPEQAPRISFWLVGLGVGQILGGAVSYGFQNLSGGVTIAGWRIMFLTLGLVTVVFGVLTWFLLPDNPMEAKWLSDKEKVALLRHISINQTGVEHRKVRVIEIWEALRDAQVWLIWLSVVLIACTGGITVAYSATLIRNMGYTPKQATLLNMPGGLISIASQLIPGWGVRRGGHRWAWVLVTLLPAIIGSALMSFLPSTKRAGVLAGIYLTNFIPGPLTVYWNWAPANVAGATKRAFVTALIGACAAIGSIIGAQSFQARDAPEYRPAKITALATQAAGACTTVLLFLWYVWRNRSRGLSKGGKERERETEEAFMNPEVWARMTDRENTRFRYNY